MNPDKPDKPISLDEQDRKAELSLVMEMEKLDSAGAKRKLADKIGIEWDEWLRIQRKYKRIIESYRRQR